jgi:hypothetical protein
MVERERAEPAFAGVDAERVSRGGGAGGVVSEGELDRLGRAGGAGGVDDGVDRVGSWAVSSSASAALGPGAGYSSGLGGSVGATGSKTAPRRGAAWSSSAKAMPGGCETRTRSPHLTPRAISPLAKRMARWSSSAYVTAAPSATTAK